MTEALFGFVGVIVGALASAGTTFWVTRWSARQDFNRRREEQIRAELDLLLQMMDEVPQSTVHLIADPYSTPALVDFMQVIDRMGSQTIKIGDDPLRRAYWSYRGNFLTHYATQTDIGRERFIEEFGVENALELPAVRTSRTHMRRRIAILLANPSQLQPLNLEHLEDHDFDQIDGTYIRQTSSTGSYSQDFHHGRDGADA